MLRGLDLFAGIGGFSLAMQQNHIKVIGFSEIDQYAIKTYYQNFKDHYNFGDITKLSSSQIPPYDLLTAGFPCQPFSMLGSKQGFKDIRGTLFFEVARIIQETRPRWFILENVRGLLSNNGGKTFQTILDVLGPIHNNQYQLSPYEDHLGYKVYWKVLNALDYGLPQSRQRVFIVGLRYHKDPFQFPKPCKLQQELTNLLEDNPPKYCRLTPHEYERWKQYAQVSHFAGKCYDEIPQYSPTITAGYNKTKGNAIKIKDQDGYRILSPRECLRLQGYPDSFQYHKNFNQAYKQIGNSIPVPIASLIMKELLKNRCD